MKELSIDELYTCVYNEPNNIVRKLDFYLRILGSNFFVVLENSDFEEDLRPSIFDTQEGKFLLCFESIEKLTNFITKETAHAVLSFKEIIELIKNKKIGIALNVGDHSGVLLDLEAVDWIQQVISTGPSEELNSIPIEFEFPNQADKNLFDNLKITLKTVSGMTKKVVLAHAHYKDLSFSCFIGFIDTPRLFHELIRERVLDTVKLDKSNSVFVDVAFLSSSMELASKLLANGLTVQFPKVQRENKNGPVQSNTGVPKLR
jgi:hypothetical protein